MIFFNEHRLPLIGRTVISKKLYRKNLQKSFRSIPFLVFPNSILRSILFARCLKNQSQVNQLRRNDDNVDFQRSIVKLESIRTKSNLSLSLSLSLLPLHRSRIQRVHRARGGSFVFHFPSDTRADCSIELH